MENNDRGLCKAFVDDVTAMLAWAPQMEYELTVSDDEAGCSLHIPKASDDGFDILIEVEPDDITVWAEGGSFHFDPEPPFVETAQSVVSLLQRLLSPDMRVRKLCTWGRPYRWEMQVLLDGEWRTVQTTALWIGISLGRSSERIYQNRLVESPVDQD